MRGFLVFLVSVAIMAGGAAAFWYDFPTMGWTLEFGGLVGVVWVVADSMWQRHNDELYQREKLVIARTKFTLAISAADGETRKFLGKEWPELGLEFDEQHVVYLLADGVNTGILLAYFQRFLQDSNTVEFADVRKYNDDTFLQERFNVSREFVRKQWHLVVDFLKSPGMDYLVLDSMRGSHTYQWKSKGHYKSLLRKYMNVREIPELSEA
jgi:hypothetical protein